jgi:hypothetical protein
MPRELPKTTTVVGREEGVTPSAIVNAIIAGRLSPPQKDAGGRYVWWPEDVARLRVALATDRRKTPRRRTQEAAGAAQ